MNFGRVAEDSGGWPHTEYIIGVSDHITQL
jgi:hypothetical protein